MEKKPLIISIAISVASILSSVLFIILSNLNIFKYTKQVLDYNGKRIDHEFKYELFSFVSSGNKPLANVSLAVFIITIAISIACIIISIFVKKDKIKKLFLALVAFFLVATFICFFNMIGYSKDLILTL